MLEHVVGDVMTSFLVMSPLLISRVSCHLGHYVGMVQNAISDKVFFIVVVNIDVAVTNAIVEVRSDDTQTDW